MNEVQQYANELYHHGVKGMKWGVRRTPEQLGHRTRYVKLTEKQKKRIQSKPIDGGIDHIVSKFKSWDDERVHAEIKIRVDGHKPIDASIFADKGKERDMATKAITATNNVVRNKDKCKELILEKLYDSGAVKDWTEGTSRQNTSRDKFKNDLYIDSIGVDKYGVETYWRDKNDVFGGHVIYLDYDMNTNEFKYYGLEG